MKRLGNYIAVTLTSVFLITSFSYACVGARPMAMGGAFIAVADDANTTYWNPAGLDQKKETREEVIKRTLDKLEGLEVTYTGTLHNRDQVNYDDFISIITPLKLGQQDWGNLGLSLVNSGYNREFLKITDRWYWISYAKYVGYGLSLGVNLRYQRYKHKVKEGWMILYPIGWVIGPRSDSDGFFAIDPALLWRWGKFSFGLLYQNLNEPEAEIFGITHKWIRNLRPGIAYRPDDKTIIALDMYDATGETEGKPRSVAHNLHIGIEKWFNFPPGAPEWLGNSFALRAGGYHFNRRNRIYTFGCGFKNSPKDNSLKDIHLDYTLLYWANTPPGIDEFTHQMALTFKF